MYVSPKIAKKIGRLIWTLPALHFFDLTLPSKIVGKLQACSVKFELWHLELVTFTTWICGWLEMLTWPWQSVKTSLPLAISWNSGKWQVCSKAKFFKVVIFYEPISFPGFLGEYCGLSWDLIHNITESQGSPKEAREGNWFMKKLTYLKKFGFCNMVHLLFLKIRESDKFVLVHTSMYYGLFPSFYGFFTQKIHYTSAVKH